MEASAEGHAALRPQAAHQLDLFLGSLASVGEILAQCLVFDGVPTDADAEAQPSIAQQVDLGGLLCDQRGLTLGKDDDARYQLDGGRDTGEKSEHHQRFVKGGVHVIRPAPAGMDARVGADDMVIGEDMREVRGLDVFGIGAHSAGIRTDLGLGKHHSDAHLARLPVLT